MTLSKVYVLVFLSMIFLAVSILIFSELFHRQKLVLSAAEEDALWASYQLDREALKLNNALMLLEHDINEDKIEEARLRFDILYSRINLIKQGQLGILFNRISDSEILLSAIEKKLQFMDPLLFGDDDAIAISVLIEQSSLLLKRTENIVFEILTIRSADKVQHRNESIDLFVSLSTLLAVLTVTIMLMVNMLFKQLKEVRHSYKKSQDMTVKLEDAVSYAQNALKIKTEFVSTMSHEIRTPMNAIIGFSHLILADNIGHETRSKTKKIQKASSNLLSIINSILDFEKIESGKISVEKTWYDLDSVLEFIYFISEQEAKKKRLHFTVTRDFSMPSTMMGDSFRLEQILINLVSNAVKFTHDGFVSVKVNLAHGRLVFEVSDSGIGIEENANIFDAFHQADSSTSRLYGGTGLGLSISQKLVAMMGGAIEYESKLTKGTTFLVSFPYQDVMVDLVDKNDSAAQEKFKQISVRSDDHKAITRLNNLHCHGFAISHNAKGDVSDDVNLFSVEYFKHVIEPFQQDNKNEFKSAIVLHDDDTFYAKQEMRGLLTPKNILKFINLQPSEDLASSRKDVINNVRINSRRSTKAYCLKSHSESSSNVMSMMSRLGVDLIPIRIENILEGRSDQYLCDFFLIDCHALLDIETGLANSLLNTLNDSDNKVMVFNVGVLKGLMPITKWRFDSVITPWSSFEEVSGKIDSLLNSTKTHTKKTGKTVKNKAKLRKVSASFFAKIIDLENSLMNGEADSEAVMQSILVQYPKECDFEFLQNVLLDIEDYEFDSAAMKIEKYRKALVL